MEAFTAEEKQAIEANPLGSKLEDVRRSLNEHGFPLSLSSSTLKMKNEEGDAQKDWKPTLTSLLVNLLLHPASEKINMRLEWNNKTLQIELVQVYHHLWREETDSSLFEPLATLIRDQANDIEIWSAARNLASECYRFRTAYLSAYSERVPVTYHENDMLSRLSRELLLKVLEYLPKSDLKALRLSSRVFCKAASPLVFARVYVSVHDADLKILRKIAGHEVLRRFARELVYTGVFFCREGLHEHYPVGCLCNMEKPPNGGRRQVYWNYFQSQIATIEKGHDCQNIRWALSEMFNIKKVIITDHWAMVNDLSMPRTYSLTTSRLPDDCGSPFCRAYPRNPSKPLTKPSGGPFYISDGTEGWESYNEHAFFSVIRAISEANHKLDSFVVDYSPVHGHLTGLSMAIFDVDEPMLDHYCKALGSLQRLDLSFSYHKFDKEQRLLDNGTVGRVLAALHVLEDLKLDFVGCWHKRLPLGKLLGDHTWQNLRALRVFSIHPAEEDLLALISRHTKSLKCLMFGNILLESGRWKTLLEFIKLHMEVQEVYFDTLRERIDVRSVYIMCTTAMKNYLRTGQEQDFYDEVATGYLSNSPSWGGTPVRVRGRCSQCGVAYADETDYYVFQH